MSPLFLSPHEKFNMACIPPPAWGGEGLKNFRDIRKMHLLSSEKTSFSMVICCKCLENSVVFPVDLFWSNLHLMFLHLQGWSVFTGLINWRGLQLSYLNHSFILSLNVKVYIVYCISSDFMLFFLFVKSYVGWEVCVLASHHYVVSSWRGSKRL